MVAHAEAKLAASQADPQADRGRAKLRERAGRAKARLGEAKRLRSSQCKDLTEALALYLRALSQEVP